MGVKDVAYFLSSCLPGTECEARVPGYLDYYFAELCRELKRPGAPAADAAALEREWRELFAWAWLDFYRFLLGWAPRYAAQDEYAVRLLPQLMAQLR